MEYTQIFADAEVREEFLDRFEEIRDAASVSGGLESVGGLEGILDVDRAAGAVKAMAEGTWQGDESGLEAIVRQFGRPVYLVRRNTFGTVADAPDDEAESRVVAAKVKAARRRLEGVIPSVGRIDLRNHDLDWVGTGWMVAEDLAVTNRHVAEQFAKRGRGGFRFRANPMKQVHAYVDWRHEHGRTQESRFKVTEVVWIEPDSSACDAALLRLAPTGENGEPLPPPIELAKGKDGLTVGRWVGVIGYPFVGRHDDPEDRTRIFNNIFECKRLAPGQLISSASNPWIHHDATTLGGNSGSVVVDLDTGRALGLHFQGLPGKRNDAVPAADVARLIRKRAS
ncbi:trypsin-like serine peptidase [Streptomyces sp. NBC_00989]|uniref:trypsin-like serine peptidase n=1 Tax=Streptomyces sp. NBC_00989 TaxID=2903705 RepID=UPI003866C849|nr:serine protease [Streptomyces sp. NBC_00989]